MTVPPPVDRSLYELVIQTAPTASLQLSPTTFKSMVGILLDFLLEQKTAAIVWLKLPRGKVWQTELERFCQAAQLPHQIYLLQTQAEWLEEAASKFPYASQLPEGAVARPEPALVNPLSQEAEWAGDLMDITLIEAPLSPNAPEFAVGSKARVHPLTLTAETQLKREYFLLAATADFYGLLLAHRPRSTRSTSMDAGGLGRAAMQDEEMQERKHPLLTLYSFDSALLQSVLEGIHYSVTCGESTQSLEAPPSTWKALRAQGFAQRLDPLLLTQLLTKQVQRQEDLWRSGAIERQRAKQAVELQQQNQELQTTLQQKSDFVQNLGQELRTPLATMKTALSLLNSPNLKPPQRQKYMEMLSRECDRQNSLISSGLSLLQIEKLAEFSPQESLRLSEIVPGVVSTYQPLAEEKGLRLAYTVPEDLPPVACSPNGLRQIVINLLHNSIKFTPKGGQVWVKARQQGNQILIEFRDTGTGITPSELPKIFDRFYRSRPSGEDSGVGLGLTIVQQLVHHSGGSISVKSKPGEGTVFVVVLPIRSHLSDLGSSASRNGSAIAGEAEG